MPLAADNQEKTQKKELEAQVKTMKAEAERLEKSGRLAEARTKYAESQALIEVKDVTEAIKRLDEQIRKKVKDSLSDARKYYEVRKFKEAAVALEESMKLEAFQPLIAYNLALCYYQLQDRDKALEYLRQARMGSVEPKQKQRVMQLMTIFTTGESGIAVKDTDKNRMAALNRLTDSVGIEASLEDDAGGEDDVDDDSDEASSDSPEPSAPAAPTASQPASTQTPTSQAATTQAPRAHSNIHATRRSSLCNELGELKGAMAKSPAAVFDLANCAESNGRTAEAVQLLEKYLELAPNAMDATDVRARIADLKLLLALPGQKGVEVRRLYASVYSALAERRYERALNDLTAAGKLAPDFALTNWKLALLYEAMEDIDEARKNFLRYQELATEQKDKDEATLHLSTLDAKRTKYEEEIDEAEDIVADLFNRAMNLTFNGDSKRSALRARRARVKKKDQQKARNRVGGFAIPYAFAQQQLMRASEHLQVALALFPLGAEANELMALVFLQANDGHAAMHSFDVVASQNLPVAFYAEMRGHKQDHGVKCELNHDGVRLIFLSTYDKNGRATPPAKPAGDDGLGDMTLAPGDERQSSFDSLDLKLSDIKRVETNSGILRVKLPQHDISLAPIYLTTFTPVEGPQARRFANTYTRLFVRYPGLEDSKLGVEGMSGGEKFKMGYKIATAGADIAMNGFNPVGAISSIQDVVSITRTIHTAVSSLSVSFSAWERTVDDQQQLLSGKAFKEIPVQPVSLGFVQEMK